MVFDSADTLVSMFNVACCACLNGDLETAHKTLLSATQLGFCDVQSLKTDHDLGMLRDTMHDDFEKLIKKCEGNKRKKEKPKLVLESPDRYVMPNVHV